MVVLAHHEVAVGVVGLWLAGGAAAVSTMVWRLRSGVVRRGRRRDR